MLARLGLLEGWVDRSVIVTLVVDVQEDGMPGSVEALKW